MYFFIRDDGGHAAVTALHLAIECRELTCFYCIDVWVMNLTWVV